MIIAIDYDGTITDNTPYPFEGKIRDNARIYIEKLWQDGHTLILWSARPEPYHQEALDRLNKECLLQYFTSIKKIGRGATGKIVADFYIDDRSYIGDVDWSQIYQYISRIGETE